MNELIKQVQEWSIERGLHKADPRKQMLKVIEETSEVAAAMARGKEAALIDGIGDVMVTLIILAQQMDVDITYHAEKTEDTMYVKGEDGVDTFLFIFYLIEKVFDEINYANFNGKTGDLGFKNLVNIIRQLKKLSKIHNTTLEHCLQTAYNEIAGRTGQMVDGTFVKDEDLKQKDIEALDAMWSNDGVMK